MVMNKLSHVKTDDGVEYPVLADINALEELQEKYGSIDKWADSLSGEEVRLADIKFTFLVLINNGIDYENEIKGENRKMLTLKQVGRLISSLGTDTALGSIFTSVSDNTGKGNNEKNLMMGNLNLMA